MAENVVINFEANTQGLLPAVTLLEKLGQIDKATADTFRKQTSEYQQQLSQRAAATTTAFEKLKTAVNSVKVDNGLAKALDQSAPVLKTANSVSSLRQQVREATAEAVLLAQKYGDLDPRAIAAAQAAAKLKEELGDVNARINALNPEAKFTAIAQLAGGIAGAFTAAQGALGLLGLEGEDTQKALLKVQQALALSQGLNQVMGLKDAFTNLRAVLGLTTAAQVANTTATEADAVAKGVNTVATEGATVATRAFNAALLTNPIFLAVAAISALATAYLVLSDNEDEAKKSQEEFNRQLELSKAGYDGITAAIERQNAAILSALDAQIKIRQNEGAGELELFNLRLAKIDEEIEAKERLRRQNAVQNQEDLQFANELLRLGTEESVKRSIEIERSVDQRKQANKQILEDEKRLKQDREVLLSEFGKSVADAEKQRVEEEKKRSEEIYNKKLASIEAFYNKVRADEGQRIDDSEFYKQVEIDITRAEYRDKIELAEKFGKDYTQFLLKLQETNRNNPIIPIVKIDPLQSAGQIGFTDKDIEDAQARVQNYYQSEEQRLSENLDEQNRIDGLKQNAREQIYQNSLNALSTFLDGQFQLQAEANQRALEQQQELIQQEEELNKSKYDKGIIGIKEFRDTERKLEEERKKAAEEARKREIELKRKADLAARAQAIFQIGVSTALNVNQQPGPFGSLIPFWIALGAAQSAAVLARPLPKYQKGTLSLERGSNPTGTDTVPILANEGEAIIPTDKSRAYRPTLEALYKGLLSPRELNGMVMKRLRDGRSESRTPVVDYDTLARKIGSEMAWVLRGRDGVVIKNVDDFAAALGGGQLINRNA
jgi:hypothetical protein